ncbi:MAG: desulfoferrodoxin [Candidatus Aerophobetes bacterium]|nr:desulfoferrodoxin [Candidatus Aerophobetes bacterium]
MTQKLQIYKCEVCGNIVEVLHQGRGQLVCCGEPMKLMKEKTEEEGKEKHLPVVEKTDKGIKVKVGSIPHPMEESHYIEWIEVQTDGESHRKFLSPGNSPEAEFPIKAEKINVLEYCSIHGLWKRPSLR